MKQDAFSQCHPAVNFCFFVGAIVFSMLTRHPLYLLVGVLCGAVYLLLLERGRAWKTVCGMLPLFLLISGVNPLFNTRGNTVLFRVFNRPYTLEALLYGMVLAAAFVMVILWFRCYSIVLTGDKFTALFAGVVPSLSLLLVMIFRMVPHTAGKARQIDAARRTLGKGVSERDTLLSRVKHGTVILSALTSLSLEESVVTGDSMRARGYGAAKRSGFMLYRMTGRDVSLSVLMGMLFGITVIWNLCGLAEAVFLPYVQITEPAGVFWVGFAAYSIYLSIPIVLSMKEAIAWYISRSRI